MKCHESLHFLHNWLHVRNKTKFRYFVTRSIFSRASGNGSQRNISHFAEHNEQYTARSLTYPSDSLNAVLGISQDFRRAPSSIYHFWGLPIESEMKGVTARSLAMSLGWGYQDFILRRRPAFPSWSWDGWEGRVHMLSGIGENPIASIHARFGKNATLPSISLEKKRRDHRRTRRM